MSINVLKSRRAGSWMAAALLLSAGGAQAACSQADLTGTWYAVGVGGNVGSGSFDEIDRCKIRISSTGAVIATGSSCSHRYWAGTAASNITGGSIKVASSCVVTGSLRFCNSNGCSTGIIQYAQMERGKTAFAMAGYLSGSPQDVAFWEVIKQ